MTSQAQAQQDLANLETDIRADTREVLNLAELLVFTAMNCGLVVTVETVPLAPLAMGHYDLKVNVRPNRATVQRLLQLQAQVHS